MQGVAATVLAGVLGAVPKTGKALKDHVFLLSGEGPQASCIAELLAAAVAQQSGCTVLDTRQRIWLVDSKGQSPPGAAATVIRVPCCNFL